ncbi:hypothetical protein [Frankia tisae]|uniref:hypothetical protein n=1 Tax=Frankia tisae TaxID=2950104 RepID=UPI0021BFF551|nr:hypothetical protein [Frankia tisae]
MTAEHVEVAVDVRELFDPRRRSDPYPLYRALRESGRCHWLSPQAPRIGVIMRHGDCVAALQEGA